MSKFFGARILYVIAGIGSLVPAWPGPAAPMAGTNTFLRAPGATAAISVEAILAGDLDTAQVPLTVSSADAASAAGGAIFRTNDWFYCYSPSPAVATDSFHYVVMNLLGQATNGTVVLVTSSNLPPTNYLQMAVPASGGPQFRFRGSPGPYWVQASGDLVTWTNLGARLAWPSNQFTFVDANAGSRTRRYYRTSATAAAPVITNYQATGTANVQADFNLGVEGGLATPYPATVLTLPASGYLFQDDGSIISNAPALVTGTNGALHYFGPVNGQGQDFASFQYQLTRPSDGLQSWPGNFQINLGADEPLITSKSFVIAENVGGFLQLTASDPDLRYASNHLTFTLRFVPLEGSLYQVNPDGSPASTLMQNGDTVSNPNGLTYYVPPANQYGSSLSSIVALANNNFGGQSEAALLPIDVYFAPQPPVAPAVVAGGDNSDSGIPGFMDVSDVDSTITNITFTTAPNRGLLFYAGSPVPVSATNHSFAFGNSQFVFYTASQANGAPPCFPDPADVGAPYVQFDYTVTDAYGLSASNTITINVAPFAGSDSFPFPSGPFQFTGLVNSTNIPAVISMTNRDGSALNDSEQIILTSLPRHGTLYFDGFPLSRIPDMLPPVLNTPLPLYYVPDPGYYTSADGPDGFTYSTRGPSLTLGCSSNVVLTVIAPPSISTVSTTSLSLDDSNNTLTPGICLGSIQGGSAPANALLQLTIAGWPAGMAPYGNFVLNETNGLAGVVTNAPASLQLRGTAAALNAALAAGFQYYATPSSQAGDILCTLNDEGATGFGTNVVTAQIAVTYLSGGTLGGN